jgi:hypothetical protein
MLYGSRRIGEKGNRRESEGAVGRAGGTGCEAGGGRAEDGAG